MPGDRSRHVSAALIARCASAEYDNGRTRGGCGRVECLLRRDAGGASANRRVAMTRGSAPERIAGALPLLSAA
ncbi:hypothetical protein Xmar_06440 [Xanthomonas axonopodis pv. martyniicola]|uniref:Uncharacterized protein n=1 Tax=Xanthomonas cissicola TaxID=86186 RepID=A0ABX3M510_9XANT|nr:hypothetical protein Xmar_06440 [Xanthomonas axonopodis pv. martyniicola]OOW76285.1 hypothetical protein Xant_03105 [Xanthomonas cissicola]OOW89034.1 hypothetical protein Xvtr_03205 [Xanthomonas campestris pv. vitiscarnosae]OOW94619.1 hypothetical protein Xvtf_03805 [Xanthomonas campestris pv. vitistrifoliae]PNV27792.1 hypothetical protein xavtCFBP7764_16600 [Xanthomonas citri]